MNGRKKKVPEEIGIKHAKNGGFIVRHSFNNMGSGESYMPPEEHAFGNHADMLAHVTKHTKRSPYAEGEPDADDVRPAGISGKPKQAPPTARSRGAGMD